MKGKNERREEKMEKKTGSVLITVGCKPYADATSLNPRALHVVRHQGNKNLDFLQSS